ncbi:hypothetical protein JIG36_51060 [Actinoplanes sp. LDG1-06]|uniref:Uncharacterized protein n=1 Tax=Paractinoplanes ovalisporus TaxID=2810368 RepID=A0ABS2AVV6_9ACTN|nr:hypothetical protein [Actinoplanes ovalisporus]MBM2623860.1 hypothetical protein [Actinoplanes ovalisporus]
MLALKNGADAEPVIVRMPDNREVILRGKHAADFLVREGLALPRTVAKATGLDDDGPDVDIDEDGDVTLTGGGRGDGEHKRPRYY